MKLVPGPLPPLPSGATMERLPLPLPFSPELLWRYPLGFPGAAPQMMDFKTHLPAALPTDPRLWSRDDVLTFLKWSEREFDLQPFDLDMFQMNGKALCLLTRNDLSERSPGSGDVLHNVLQLLIRDATILQRCLPSSPVTPTSRHAYPLSPHSQPPTPNWNILAQTGESFHPSIAAHFMAQSNSVTLSPAPSVDSQAGSPQHADTQNQMSYGHTVFGNGSNGSGSNQSDSDEDSYQDSKYQEWKGEKMENVQNGYNGTPPNTPSAVHLPVPQATQPPRSPNENKMFKDIHNTVGAFRPISREFFPADSPEPNTNGRLLWDFLQQLLNDPTQRYTNYIAWKNRDTGVFKIVDPAGLAKLWGIQKNHLSMNYDKMSRALRYYYRVNILRKVQGERHCYQFLRNPTELKNIKNISLLRQQMSPTRPNPPTNILQTSNNHQSSSLPPTPTLQQPPTMLSIKSEPSLQSTMTEPAIDIIEHKVEQDDEEMPTDLSMVQPQVQPTDLSLIKSSDSYHSLKVQPTDLSRSSPQDIVRETYHSISPNMNDDKK